MHFCWNCGEEPPENVTFCPYCDAQSEEPVEEIPKRVSEAMPTKVIPSKRWRNFPLILALVAIIAVAIIGVVWILMYPPSFYPTTPTLTSTPTPTPPTTTNTPASTPIPTSTPTSTPTTTPTSTPTTIPTLPTTTPTFYSFESFKDLIETIPQMSYKWSDSNGTDVYVSYQLMEEEVVDDVLCWVINCSISEDGQESSLETWISQSDGEPKKMLVDGEKFIFGEEMFELTWEAYALLLTYPFIIQEALIPETFNSEYGETFWLGEEDLLYGETFLKVDKYKFTPGSLSELKDMDNLEFWTAGFDEYSLITFLKVTFKDDSWALFELLDISI